MCIRDRVSNSYIRLVDESNEVELIHYDLGEDFSIETAVVVGELYRHNGAVSYTHLLYFSIISSAFLVKRNSHFSANAWISL